MNIKMIAENFVDNMLEGMNYSGENYCIFSLDTLDYAIEEDLKELAWRRAEKIETSDRFEDEYYEIYAELNIIFTRKIMALVEGAMTKLGFDIYEGEFFPCNGYFKSLQSDQVAFIK